jgi:hypothetical protein
MISRLYLTPIIFVVGVVWLALLALDGVVIELQWLRHGATVVPVLLVALGAFDNWLWKARCLNGWFTKRPVLCGTWQVTLQTEWVNAKTGERPGPIDCYMVIRQTFSSLSMRLMTPESVSWLIAHNIVRSNDGTFQVAGVYMNKPDLSLRGERSEIHYGALLLDVQGQPPSSLSGHYWTDRQTRGKMDCTRKITKVCATYAEAQHTFESTGARLH